MRGPLTESANRPYIAELDQVRGLAALLVLFYHGFELIGAPLAFGAPFDSARHWVTATNPLIAVVQEGHSGVGLFIVLSGFVLSLGALGRRIEYGRFLLARILRIYPVLVVLLIAAYSSHPRSAGDFIATLLPLNATDAIRGPFTGMFWTVDVEFLCYLAFPFLLLFSGRGGNGMLLRVIVLAVVLRFLAVQVDGASARDISYWTVLGRIDQFCIGMIAARLHTLGAARLTRGSRVTWLFLVAPIIVLWLYNRAGGYPVLANWKIAWPTFEGAMWAGFLLAYVRVGPLLPRLISWPLTRIGVVSYSMYMFHPAVISLVVTNHLFWRASGVGHYDALLTTACVVLPLALGIGALSYVTIERPFLQLRPRYLLPRDMAAEPR